MYGTSKSYGVNLKVHRVAKPEVSDKYVSGKLELSYDSEDPEQVLEAHAELKRYSNKIDKLLTLTMDKLQWYMKEFNTDVLQTKRAKAQTKTVTVKKLDEYKLKFYVKQDIWDQCIIKTPLQQTTVVDNIMMNRSKKFFQGE